MRNHTNTSVAPSVLDPGPAQYFIWLDKPAPALDSDALPPRHLSISNVLTAESGSEGTEKYKNYCHSLEYRAAHGIAECECVHDP